MQSQHTTIKSNIQYPIELNYNIFESTVLFPCNFISAPPALSRVPALSEPVPVFTCTYTHSPSPTRSHTLTGNLIE